MMGCIVVAEHELLTSILEMEVVFGPQRIAEANVNRQENRQPMPGWEVEVKLEDARGVVRVDRDQRIGRRDAPCLQQLHLSMP